MSLMFPHVISIYRPKGQAPGGVRKYGGQSRDDMTLIISGVAANIQAKNSGRSAPTGLPSDTPMAEWKVYTARGALAGVEVKNHDVVVDNKGRRFGVTSDYDTALGGNFFADRLES